MNYIIPTNPLDCTIPRTAREAQQRRNAKLGIADVSWLDMDAKLDQRADVAVFVWSIVCAAVAVAIAAFYGI